MSIFGRIISDDQVEDAIIATIRKWISTELAEVEHQHGLDRGYYPRPRDYEVRNEFSTWPEEQIPMVLAICPGLATEPVKTGRGIYRATWVAGVAGVVSNVGSKNTRRHAYRMGAAIRASLIHNQSLDQALDGTIRGVTWIAERTNGVPVDDGRTLWASRQLFHVEVDDVLTQNAGPTQPIPDPTDEFPIPTPEDPHPDDPAVPDIDHVVTDLTKEPIT